MTLKYESELLYGLMKRDGDDTPSDVLPYESELKEKYLNQVVGAYPKLQDYRAEWLNYNLNYYLPSDFPTESVTDVTNATFQNVVPYVYQSAILKGSTKYRDIDTGEFLETFEEGRNLELVTVKMPVLTTTGKNLLDINTLGLTFDGSFYYTSKYYTEAKEVVLNLAPNTSYTISIDNSTYITLSVNGVNNPFVNNMTTFTTLSDGVTKIKLGATGYANVGTGTLSWIQLEQGTTATSYEPYKSNILTVNEDVTLRGIGEGSNRVEDELDYLTGEVTQRIGEVVLDGSENWKHEKTNTLTSRFFIKLPEYAETTGNVNISFVTDKIQVKSIYDIDEEGMCSLWGGFYLRVSNDKMETPSVANLQKYLSQNPIKMCYQLATESIKTVDLICVNEQGENVDFTPIEGTMHVSTSSDTLPPLLDMTVPVEAITQNLNSFANIKEE